MLLRDQHMGEFVLRRRGAVHAGDVGDEAGAVGDGHHLHHGLGAVDEFDQHARIHVAGVGLRLVVGGHGIPTQRVVLALAGADDLEADGLGEADQLQRGGGLVAGGAGVDDAGALCLRMEMAADGDVGLDVEHHHMLAIGDGGERELRAGVGVAGRVDHHIHAAGAGERFEIVGDGDQAVLDGRVDGGGGFGIDEALVGDAPRSWRRPAPAAGASRRWRPGGARHAGQLHHHVGAHLAAAGKSDGDGSPRIRAGFQFCNERGDACDHAFFVTFFLAARTLGTSRRTGPVTESASPFFNSPGCFP